MHQSIDIPKRTGLKGALYDNSNFFGGRIRVLAYGRPYDYKEQDWTLRHLQNSRDGLTVTSSITEHLPLIAKELGVTEIVAPIPDFGGKVCFPSDLVVVIPIGDRLVLRRGVKSDGCVLSLGQTYAVSSAGCSIGIVWYPNDPKPGERVRVVTSHVGFDSLFDRQEALTGLISREPASITESMLDAIGCWKKPSRRKRVGGTILFPIAPSEFTYPWDHAEFGHNNELVCEFLRQRYGEGAVPGNTGKKGSSAREGKIDMGELFTQQLVSSGVPIEHISLLRTIDTFDQLRHTDGTPMWYSTRGPFANRRNLVLVHRCK